MSERCDARPSEPPSRRTGISATLAANEALERKRREGVPVLPMAFGEAGLPVHPALRRELADAAGRNGYGPVAGSPELRAAAAGYWTRRGLPTDPELVVAGPGSKALLFGLLLIIGGEVAVPQPSWVSYAAQAALTGAGALFVPTRPDEGGVPDPELLAEAVRAARRRGRDVRSVVATLPDNPTGRLAGESTVRRLCEVARELDLLIISDEIYRDLVHASDETVSSPALFAPERTVVTTALSKHLAAGGWRLGVARLPEGAAGRALRADLLGTASEIWSCAPAPIQRAAAYAFSEPPELVEHVDRSRRLHAAVAGAVAARFTAAGCRVPAPQASFYVYPDFAPVADRLAEQGVRTGAELAELLLDRYGVGTLPGSAFGEPAPALRLRVATSLLYGESDEQRLAALEAEDPVELPWIARSLDRLERVLSEVTAAEPVPAGAALSAVG
ncbi:pyridoxal phosphate-dependent aminotransferase [Thermomonospora catenispora]|uniref:pyridoxal phosphate-dependent aminotransferase n=1 Tax=Thermomonospora catenispora TaxID=2493090 RepID=UPI0011245C73|nr:pyridoxal phosphate-dependent aminotransferase [Thermomonospora catenispora]TNY35074.1 pyridoxal phosphate-dependent aminotransferase [Thermomonospora catenispora]